MILSTIIDIFVIVCFFFLPITSFMVIKCFYDDSIRITRLKAILVAANALIMIMVNMAAGTSDKVNALKLLPIYFLMYVVQPIIISADKKKQLKYYIENIILHHVVFNFLFIYLVSASVIICMTLLKLNIIDISNYYVLCMSITLILQLPVFLWLYFAFVRKKITLFMRKFDTLLFCLYYLFSIYCMATCKYSLEASVNLAAYVSERIFMILLLVLMPIVIINNRKTAYYNELSTRNEQFLEAELIASNAYRQSQEDTCAFRHDMNNNLSIVSALLNKNKYDEAEEYINDLRGKLSSFSPRIVTGDDMLDALFSSKLAQIEGNGIQLTVSGVIDGGLGWKPIDVCAVFANMIDNAVEACDKVEGDGKYISVSMKKTDFQRVITFKNSVENKVDCSWLNDGSHYTSKSDKSRHGFGMKNIRTALEKYGAMMQISCTDTEFTTQIIMMK